jgi:hypothetical protein
VAVPFGMLRSVTPNVEGNRRADEMRAQDHGVYPRVRLTARLGPANDIDNFLGNFIYGVGRSTARHLIRK